MLDKTTARTISADALAALQAVADKHGLTVTAKGGTYGGGVFAAKFEFKTGDADAEDYALYAPSLGLPPDGYGAIFTSGGEEYVVDSIAPRSWKRPIICKKVGTDQRFKFTADAVRAALTKEAS